MCILWMLGMPGVLFVVTCAPNTCITGYRTSVHPWLLDIATEWLTVWEHAKQSVVTGAMTWPC